MRQLKIEAKAENVDHINLDIRRYVNKRIFSQGKQVFVIELEETIVIMVTYHWLTNLIRM